jgi:hypothetical protein|mmetsp:Transcript_72841/g.122070  ORF Transcript_72841/g.122070 Transcript_72841/m.122070 type:complete len:152 (-) Transcript_72841:57-512(-)
MLDIVACGPCGKGWQWEGVGSLNVYSYGGAQDVYDTTHVCLLSFPKFQKAPCLRSSFVVGKETLTPANTAAITIFFVKALVSSANSSTTTLRTWHRAWGPVRMGQGGRFEPRMQKGKGPATPCVSVCRSEDSHATQRMAQLGFDPPPVTLD